MAKDDIHLGGADPEPQRPFNGRPGGPRLRPGARSVPNRTIRVINHGGVAAVGYKAQVMVKGKRI